MTIKEYKKLKAFINKLVNKIKDEAFEEGVDTTTPEFELIIENIVKKYLVEKNYSYEEFKEIEQSILEGKELEESEIIYAPELAKKSRENRQKIAEETKALLKEFGNTIKSQTEEINILKKRKPDIINKIVKEKTIEKPITKVVKETIKEIDKSIFEETKKDILELQKIVSEIKMPEVPNYQKLKKELKDYADNIVQGAINTLDMPNWRKLGMGLQGQIDEKIKGVNTKKITVSATQPSNPLENDLWIDIS